jgi:hypothetical protein
VTLLTLPRQPRLAELARKLLAMSWGEAAIGEQSIEPASDDANRNRRGV